MSKPELLLPVGNMAMCLAAIHHGADAVYVGVPGFNARGRTQDFSLEELKELIDLCHLYGVKVHLAFNVLVFENELEEAAKLLEDILPLGPDAFIVQDLGLARLIRAMAPDQRIHGSTQMTVTNDEAIKLVEDLNIQRFVLGRENSLDEIKTIRANTERELEVFVHGALCVAYSGQCFTSESLGGRSANRGQCAQSCRLGYEMFVDGEKRELGAKKFLVSPQDLCGIEEVPKLIELGVNSFKVEGRLKTPEYVATTGRNYQDVIRGGNALDISRQKEMAISFGRGFFSGWLNGVDHQQLVEGTFSSHRGFEIGTIESVLKDRIVIKTHTDIQAGHGLMFETRNGDAGAKVHSVIVRHNLAEVFLLSFNHSLVKPGARVWINSDDKLSAQTQKNTTERGSMKRIPLCVTMKLVQGKPAQLIVLDEEGREVEVLGAVASPALKVATSLENARDELGSLGTTAFRLEEFVFTNDGSYISQKELKELRREMVKLVTAKRLEVAQVLELSPEAGLLSVRGEEALSVAHPKLNIVLREKAQVDDFIAGLALVDRTALDVVFLDYEFGKNYAESVQLLREQGLQVGIATTRILKPREYYNFKIIERALPDAILVRNMGAIQYFQGSSFRLFGDFSLNAANSVTVDYLLSKGLESVCASYDLNQTQLEAMALNARGLEINLHQYMPEFHMEHCVFAAFMSTGSSFRDCGKPCEKHQVELKDAYGNMHFLKADQECRNTMFRATPQSAAFLVDKLPTVKVFRFEALYERGDVLMKKITAYLNLVAGTGSVEEVTALLGTTEKYGVTEGQLNNARTWKDRKKLVEELS